MPTVSCPVCGADFEINEEEFEDEVVCPECGALLYVLIEGGELRSVAEIGEETEEEEWEEEEEEEWDEWEEEEW